MFTTLIDTVLTITECCFGTLKDCAKIKQDQIMPLCTTCVWGDIKFPKKVKHSTWIKNRRQNPVPNSTTRIRG